MEEEFVSRSQKKRAVEELQKLGAALVDLAPAQLDAMAIPAELLAAVRVAAVMLPIVPRGGDILVGSCGRRTARREGANVAGTLRAVRHHHG